jgi:3-deoxy-D-manno-octulosonic acid kinase
MIRIMLSGYEHLRPDRKNVLVATPLAPTVQQILETETLYEHAAHTPNATVLTGRAPVYVIPLGPSGLHVVVRHVMRGGLIGRFIRDRFFPPTRALHELVTSIRLRMAGVPTPEVLAIATYPAGGPFRRADIVTRYVSDSADLAAVFSDARNDAQRRPILDAIVTLLTRLTHAGAQHPDLNLKNILITPSETGDHYDAAVLDVDRVHFHSPGDPMVARANLTRLTQSLRKWRERPTTRAGALPDSDIDYIMLATAATPA